MRVGLWVSKREYTAHTHIQHSPPPTPRALHPHATGVTHKGSGGPDQRKMDVARCLAKFFYFDLLPSTPPNPPTAPVNHEL